MARKEWSENIEPAQPRRHHLDEGGRHDVTFDLRIVERVEKKEATDD